MAECDVDIDIRIVMENEGYEEEPSVYTISRQIPPPTFTPKTKPSSIRPKELFPKIPSTAFPHPDSHVYEDISPGPQFPEDPATDGSPLRPPSPALLYEDNPSFNLSPETPGANANEEVFNISKTVSFLTNNHVSVDPETLGSFHRTLTLPLQKSRSVLRNAANSNNSSVRVTNRERTEPQALGCAKSRGILTNSNKSTDFRTQDDLHAFSESCAKLNSSSVRDANEEKTSSQVLECAKREDEERDPTRRGHLTNGCRTQDDGRSAERHSRRRKKKDCKHCKNKMNVGDASCKNDKGETSTDSCASRLKEVAVNSERESEKLPTRLQPLFALPNGRLPTFSVPRSKPSKKTSVFSISRNVNSESQGQLSYEKSDVVARLAQVEAEDRALITPQKSRATMKVNSIYSQEHWNGKETSVFVSDAKEQSHFQRAYSLPARSHTPSSQNRVNLRRSVRGEPPPHPARLDKHRRGWTLHFARPLSGNSCTRTNVILLLVSLALLGIGGAALYIFFEPEKLQIIQQFLTATPQDVPTPDFANSSETSAVRSDNLYNMTASTNLQPETTTPLLITTTVPEPEIDNNRSSIVPDLNATRHCDDCLAGEVCVAKPGEEAPICRVGPDPQDPTGCAGLCLINEQICHRLDVDAFRCENKEHFCLDDEWTCSNKLCIPLVKLCDGQMNCYDHSDETNCVCDLRTHFHCGNGTSCLPLAAKCDKEIHCWDASDEMNCTIGEDFAKSCPHKNEFTCRDGQCISNDRFCDGLRDCEDGSDEPKGCQGRCNKHEFTCQNGRCITKEMKCDGIDHCGDGSDEQQCRKRVT